MKLKFKTQQFQTDAVGAVCDLFSGQEKSHATFSIVEEQQISMMQNQFGVGNALLIDDDTLLSNMHDIQRRNKLPLTTDGFASKGEFEGGCTRLLRGDGNWHRQDLCLHQNHI